VFEDAYTGVCSGKAAGMRVVAVPDEKLDKSLFIDKADQVRRRGGGGGGGGRGGGRGGGKAAGVAGDGDEATWMIAILV